MKKIEAYVKSDKLKEVIKKLKEINAPGFSYYNVTGHGKEEEIKGGVGLGGRAAFTIREDILPRSKVEVICNDEDIDKIIEAIRGGCCTTKQGDGMVFVSTITDTYRLKSKEKISKIE